MRNKKMVALVIACLLLLSGIALYIGLYRPNGSLRGKITDVAHISPDIMILTVTTKSGRHYSINTDNPTPEVAGPIYECVGVPQLSMGDKIEFHLTGGPGLEGLVIYSTCHPAKDEGHYYIKKLSGLQAWLQ
jgi:hypothetical protein